MAVERKLAAGEEEILKLLSESSQAAQLLDDEYEKLLAKYPDRWVAVGKHGLVAHHQELSGVIAAFREAGYTGSQVAVEFLDTQPRTLIL